MLNKIEVFFSLTAMPNRVQELYKKEVLDIKNPNSIIGASLAAQKASPIRIRIETENPMSMFTVDSAELDAILTEFIGQAKPAAYGENIAGGKTIPKKLMNVQRAIAQAMMKSSGKKRIKRVADGDKAAMQYAYLYKYPRDSFGIGKKFMRFNERVISKGQ